ncbi:MAG TPA: M1 family aminopeptidase [Frateuria sp.]|uniref:M1 family metallopeptidase n=1 Tax=Frateuria sp. TaxID=2211372 RepID=UPI002D808933|nr:M1 family aminopeptidase [Frateuria sp.]HET6804889.1 M1 family aminopeptidase [Frateuria sp.]
MRLTALPLVLIALAACCGTASGATADPVPHGKLPRWAVPESYRLSFKVDPRQQDFTGTTRIRVDLRQPSDHLWLHGHDLDVTRVAVTDAAGTTHAARYVEVAPKEGVVRVDFSGTLKPQQLTLTFDYTAPLNLQLQGLYKVSHAGVPYAMTQMEPISARYAFPGFDEPDFKTPFELSLTIPDDQKAVANTRQVREAPAGNGWKTLDFATTRPLPTYLVAFAVGPWDIVAGPDIPPDAYRTSPLRLRGIAARGEGHRMRHVLSETPGIIRALEDYYGFGYPWDKLDLLAAPDFAAGAMENAGLVTFRDWLLLLDPDSPAQYVRGSFNVNAHELAHQWTGDTVTTAWWNDIWLNEAFAEWMQQKLAMKLHPEYRADLDRVRGAHIAMENDSLVTARKVRQPISGNGDIATAFDAITYKKGASVLGMFEAYVGEKTFQQGMRRYIREHRFATATADDLVDAIAAAAGKGGDFKRAFKSFLDQPGVPYVQTRVLRKDGQTVLELRQRRYLPVGSKGSADHVWGVPVCVRYAAAEGSRVQCGLLAKAQGTLALPGARANAWVMPNANGSGYYRFGMGRDALARLAEQISHLTAAEQLAYADAADASFHRGDIHAGELLAALKPLTASRVREVATAPIASFQWIGRYLARTDAQRNVLDAWARTAYLPRMALLGYHRKTGEPADDALLRSTLAEFLALDVKLPQVRAELLKQGEAALERKADGRLDLGAADPDLLDTALAVAVQSRGKRAVDALIAELPRTSDPALRNAILAGLAAVEDPALAEQVRDFALDKQVKVGEMAALLRGSRDTRARRDAMWKWAVAHYDRILMRTGSFAGGRLPALMGGGGCSQQEADRLHAFFRTRAREVPGAERGLAQTVEATRLCAALKARQDPEAILH